MYVLSSFGPICRPAVCTWSWFNLSSAAHRQLHGRSLKIFGCGCQAFTIQCKDDAVTAVSVSIIQSASGFAHYIVSPWTDGADLRTLHGATHTNDVISAIEDPGPRQTRCRSIARVKHRGLSDTSPQGIYSAQLRLDYKARAFAYFVVVPVHFRCAHALKQLRLQHSIVFVFSSRAA